MSDRRQGMGGALRSKNVWGIGLSALRILGRHGRWVAGWGLVWAQCVHGQVEAMAREPDRCVFGGGERPVAVELHNTTSTAAAVELRTEVRQTASATAMALGQPRPWKSVEILAGQTILETNLLDFPAVAQPTHFLVEWVNQTNHVLGHCMVEVYPTNLLNRLEPIQQQQPIGLYDPANRIKPLLALAKLSVEDLEVVGISHFSGKLAIIADSGASAAETRRLEVEIEDLAGKNTAVVWIKPDPEGSPELEPGLFTVAIGSGAVCVVRPRAVSNLAENPAAQLNLVKSARMAAEPGWLSLQNCDQH